MTGLGRIAILVLLWLLAWGEVSIGNVLSGTAVAVALLLAFPSARHRTSEVRLSGRGVLRLIAYVIAQLWRSNLVMTRQILRPRATSPGVIAHALRSPSDEAVAVMSSIIALSPGTMTVDVAPDASSIYVHFFDLADPEDAHRSLAHLEDLSVAAMQRGVRR